MSALYSVILAGGLGSRLWPLSREMYPKQLLKFDNDVSLFQQTFLRIAGIVDDKNIITATNIKHVSMIKEQLKFLEEKFCRDKDYKVITEPVSKNTMPALAIAVKYIKNNARFSKEQPVIIAVPCDHLVFNREAFIEIVEKGIPLAQQGYIVSFSTKTNKLNENFGYLKARKNPKVSEIVPEALKVTSFIEKPDNKTQQEKLKGQLYLNTGIYMFTPDTFLTELKSNSKEIFKLIEKMEVKDTIPSVTLAEYEKMPEISVDYAIMEKTKKLVTVPFDVKWLDIGSWDVVYEIGKKDERGNYISGNALDIGSDNSFVYSTTKLVATMGLKDSIVVETDDALLVCNKKDTDGVKRIYKKLNGKNSSAKEIHKTVYRPWGYYTVLENGQGFLTKCITVNPNAKLSLQKHFHRSEHWIILEGQACVIKGKKEILLNPGDSIDIDVEEIHSLQNNGVSQLKVLEVQQGDILDENDIERLQDIYGRV